MKPFFKGILLVLLTGVSFAGPEEHEVLDYQQRKIEPEDIDWHTSSDQPPNSDLKLGRELMDQGRWKAFVEKFTPLIEQRKLFTASERAEAIFRFGYCLEKSGKVDEAMTQYRIMITKYPSFVDWSNQAFERAFEITYASSDPEEQLHVYTSLRRHLYQYQLMEQEDCPSGALARLRDRLAAVEAEMKLSDQLITEVDDFLGLPRGGNWIRSKQTPAQKGEASKP
ncbi:MAG: tetratricopeptide repeat protein [Verrucomicrobiota bacterium]